LLVPLVARLLSRCLGGTSSEAVQSWVFKFLFWLFVVAWTLYILFFVIAPRLRDIGVSPYAGLFSLIPLLNGFFLFFILLAPSGWRVEIANRR
jgi:uncharacterized membrane protein YhaH (DUF805 family)